MYHIKPESIKAFLDDNTIRFPRFQRKQTWKSEQNFKLAISVFKDFPLGVTIINKARYNGKSTRWLLDGRQRRHALLQMNANPENIYDWGKGFIGIKPQDQPADIKTKFWEVVESYLNDGDEDGFNDARLKAIQQGEGEFQFGGKTYKIDSIEDEVLDDMSEGFEEERDIDTDNLQDSALTDEYKHDLWGNLESLLFVLKTVHKKTSSKSGFTQPFDFRKLIPQLPYVDGKALSGRKLKTFIDEYLNFCREGSEEGANAKIVGENSLFEFYEMRFKEAGSNQKLRNSIKKNWSEIDASIRVVELIKEQLQDARIGVIETSSITSTDAQMIFTLINKEGTKLSAVEILSAKPSWNVYVDHPSQEVVSERKSLYKAINTDVERTVRWDYPATVYQRLKLDFLFPKYSYDKKSELDKKLTLGFKILSGIYQRGIKKEDVDSLSSNRDIVWEHDIDGLVNELNQMGEVLRSHDYFKRLTSLGVCLMSITSDACALNFLLLTYADYKRKGKPVGANKKTSLFVANALKLADQMVFEYVTFKWRGSSDSKVAKNIAGVNVSEERNDAVDESRWLNLIKGINDNQTIEDSEITFPLCKSIVYHSYAVLGISSPFVNTYDIDHIIPQASFDASDSIPSDRVKHSLFNLCPLPSKENKRKGKKTLAALEDSWLIENVEVFAQIKQDKFAKYSKSSSWRDLRVKRRDVYEKDFLLARKSMFDGDKK